MAAEQGYYAPEGAEKQIPCHADADGIIERPGSRYDPERERWLVQTETFLLSELSGWQQRQAVPDPRTPQDDPPLLTLQASTTSVCVRVDPGQTSGYQIGGEWSGDFSSGVIQTTLAMLPTHSKLRIELDLAYIEHWAPEQFVWLYVDGRRQQIDKDGNRNLARSANHFIDYTSRAPGSLCRLHSDNAIVVRKLTVVAGVVLEFPCGAGSRSLDPWVAASASTAARLPPLSAHPEVARSGRASAVILRRTRQSRCTLVAV